VKKHDWKQEKKKKLMKDSEKEQKMEKDLKREIPIGTNQPLKKEMNTPNKKEQIQSIPISTVDSISVSETLSMPISPYSVSVSTALPFPLPLPSPSPLPTKNFITTHELIVPSLGTKEENKTTSVNTLKMKTQTQAEHVHHQQRVEDKKYNPSNETKRIKKNYNRKVIRKTHKKSLHDKVILL